MALRGYSQIITRSVYGTTSNGVIKRQYHPTERLMLHLSSSWHSRHATTTVSSMTTGQVGAPLAAFSSSSSTITTDGNNSTTGSDLEKCDWLPAPGTPRLPRFATFGSSDGIAVSSCAGCLERGSIVSMIQTYCQCDIDDHNICFEQNHQHCTVSCFHYMKAITAACRCSSCLDGMILYRGSKVHYDTEICSFWRGDDPDERKFYLRNLLLIAEHLATYYQHPDNNQKEGARMFTVAPTSIRTTIMTLALIQHYAKDVNMTLNGNNYPRKTYIATPVLDCTFDIRVAASFAMLGHGAFDHHLGRTKQGVVRLLLLDHPQSIDTEHSKHWNTSTLGKKRLGSRVQRLGDTDMILVDLASILPASSVRPRNQEGCLIVSESDLIKFHRLRLAVEEKWGALCKPTESDDDCYEQVKWDTLIKILSDDEFLNDKMNEVVDDNEKWDALERRVIDVQIQENVTIDTFCHGITSTSTDDKGIETVVKENPFPILSDAQLYPHRDPMKKVMMHIATSIKEQMEPLHWWGAIPVSEELDIQDAFDD